MMITSNLILESTNMIPSSKWPTSELGDIATLNPKLPVTEIGEHMDVQFLPMRLVEELSGKTHLDQTRKYSEVKKGYTSFINGDIVFAKVTPCMENGKIAVVNNLKNGIGFGSTEFHVLRPSSKVINKYLFYFLIQDSFRHKAANAMTGAVGLRRVPKQFLEHFVIPIPAIKEQKFIVTKIEELFSELDKGIEQLKAAQQQLKVYRQAVLKYAFEGRLTHQIENAALPDGWLVKPLEQVCVKIQDGSHFSPQAQYTEPGLDRYLYITAKNIRNNYMDLSSIVYVDKNFHDSIYQRCNPEYGDVLLTKDGVNTGDVTLNTLHEPISLLSSVCLFKTRKDQLMAEYLKYYIQSPLGSKMITNSMTGTAIKRIILRKIRGSEIILPPVYEQESIIREIESRLSVCNKVEQTINDSLLQAESLRQSILKKAFEGKLLAQAELESIEERTKSVARPAFKIAAEPEVTNRKKKPDAPFPKKIEGIKDTDLHAGILAMVIYAHEKSPEHHLKLSHVKGEKIAHLVEAHIGIDLGRTPRKDAAGPDDFPHLRKVESRATKAGWLGVKKLRVGQTYVSKRGMPKIIQKVKETLRPEDLQQVESLIQQFLPFELEHAEVIATLYAAWNNLLLEGKTVTDEEIVYESRENWSKRKLGIDRGRFFKTLKWMREHGFVPEGRGKLVM